MEVELKRCPFCGGRAVTMERINGPAKYWVGNCLPCDAEGPPCETEGGAQRGWNERFTANPEAKP